MSGKLNFFLCFIQFIGILNVVYAQCNSCSSSGIACISETEYALCYGGVPTTDNVATCPSYAYCNVDSICLNITATTKPSCILTCGQCTTDLRFACVDTNKFQMCYGTSIPTSPIMTCPSGYVCDYNAAPGYFCALEGNAEPGCSGPYTPPTEPPTTTTTEKFITQPGTGSSPDRWTAWCRAVGYAGRFKYLADKKCKAYILCFVNNNILYGNYYTCIGSTVFNPKFQACVDEANYECVTT